MDGNNKVYWITNFFLSFAAVLDGRHLNHYIIYNISGRQYSSSKFNARVIEGNWSSIKAPSLGAVYNLSCSIFDHLNKNSKNIVVIHCMVSTNIFSFKNFVRIFFLFNISCGIY